jgi:pimeloyl-ACP methyl ester carboxylesterase
MSDPDTPTVVLVHGGFVDGSGWQGVYEHLKQDGYNVAVVQNPTVSQADDVAVTKRSIEAQSEPVVLVGHSYGGAVITEAGNHQIQLSRLQGHSRTLAQSRLLRLRACTRPGRRAHVEERAPLQGGHLPARPRSTRDGLPAIAGQLWSG